MTTKTRSDRIKRQQVTFTKALEVVAGMAKDHEEKLAAEADTQAAILVLHHRDGVPWRDIPQRLAGKPGLLPMGQWAVYRVLKRAHAAVVPPDRNA